MTAEENYQFLFKIKDDFIRLFSRYIKFGITILLSLYHLYY